MEKKTNANLEKRLKFDAKLILRNLKQYYPVKYNWLNELYYIYNVVFYVIQILFKIMLWKESHQAENHATFSSIFESLISQLSESI